MTKKFEFMSQETEKLKIEIKKLEEEKNRFESLFNESPHGYFTFDIQFVKNYIRSLVDSTDEYVFLFAGTEPFMHHPNVRFINEFHNPLKKAKFINTCDAMLHARDRGESFGLSIAEFLSLNKPVLAWNGGHDLNHLDMLKGSGLLYNDEHELNVMIRNISAWEQEVWSMRVDQYKPISVMNKFKEVFL